MSDGTDDDPPGVDDPQRDPVAAGATEPDEFHGVATWAPRSAVDRVSVVCYRALVYSSRTLLVLLGALLFVGIGAAGALLDPTVGVLTVLSVLPALALAAYVWWADATTAEPIGLLAATFLLAAATAGFAAVVNGAVEAAFSPGGLLGRALFFFLIVGPVEETVKLLAVRLYAFEHERFDAVVDGAVYGAVAGLGFATVENALYIARGAGGVVEFGTVTALRALAGPGHVIYSATAGYYLGLAKFNPEHRGPILLEGLALAAGLHALYNSTVGIGGSVVATLTGLPAIPAFLIYIVAYDGVAALIVVDKLRRYRRAYRSLVGGGGGAPENDGAGGGSE